jgi:hypothetical protein
VKKQGQVSITKIKPRKEESKMKKWTGMLIAGILVLGLAGSVMAQSSHDVTVSVSAISVMEMTGGGDLTITINACSDPGEEPDPVQNSDRGLEWTTNETSKRITVASNSAYSTYSLAVVATGVSGGSAAPSVDLDDADTHDFVTGVAETVGACTIQYTASATAAAGTGSEEHTVTYTLTDAS